MFVGDSLTKLIRVSLPDDLIRSEIGVFSFSEDLEVEGHSSDIISFIHTFQTQSNH